MKVLHVNNVANVPDGLVKGLRKIGVDATLYQPYTGINKPGRLSKLQVVTNRIADARALAAQISREQYDIVHIHYAYFGMLGVLGGYPYWLHCHGTDIRRNLYHHAYRKITTMSLDRADRVLYSTPDLKPHAEKARADAVFLPNPIRTEMFEPKGFEGTEDKILLISRIDRVKGVDVAFSALEKLKKNNPTLQIDAFAWGPDLERFKGCGFVNFLPKVPYEDIASLLPNYRIIIGQFELGIMGMSEMEAMACARPVVCHFEYQDWYAEAPPLVLARDEDEIIMRVEELLANLKLCEEVGFAGREWVVKYHDYISVAERLARLYEAHRP
ncbi:MAG TPA: glycosyltransferase family 4 protein [Anaerolineae bacterium]|jgi:glycosyltransferase involved in cell wall biosynthesis|nr:glycosyltransferase family 4 protein [Anaerolineae bacterium]